MRLPNFHDAVVFRDLRRKMGAATAVQLSQEAGWHRLASTGVDIADLADIETSPDGTLSYEGHRILVYIRDQYLRHDGTRRSYRYHVAECDTLRRMRADNRFGRYVGTTRRDGVFVVNEFQGNELVAEHQEIELCVCKNCLSALDWKGYKSARPRRPKVIWKAFTPDEFFDHFTSQVSCLPTHSEFTAPLDLYPEDWEEISSEVRSRSNWRCEECGVSLSEPPLRKFLHTHHRDGNKPNSDARNLEALCIHCHATRPLHERLRALPDYLEFERIRAQRGI